MCSFLFFPCFLMIRRSHAVLILRRAFSPIRLDLPLWFRLTTWIHFLFACFQKYIIFFSFTGSVQFPKPVHRELVLFIYFTLNELSFNVCIMKYYILAIESLYWKVHYWYRSFFVHKPYAAWFYKSRFWRDVYLATATAPLKW